MKKIIGLFLAIFLGIPALTTAKDYTISNVQIEAKIHLNGTVNYVEHRTYNFDGDYTWANYALPKNGFSKITDVQVSDENRQYTHENTENPGTFQISTNAKEINIKWFYRAQNEEKTFTIRFTYHDAIAIGPVWSQFQSTYISNKWKKSTKSADILVKFPRPISTDSIYNWIHGSSSQATLNTTQNRIAVHATNIGSNEFLQIRTLFPTNVLKNAIVTVPKLSLSFVQNQEEMRLKSIKKAEQRANKNKKLGILLSFIIAGMSVIVWLLFYQKYGKRFKPQGIPQRLFDLPSEESPAIAGYIVQSKSVNGSHLIATLFDLARRGYFQISQERGEKGFLKKSKERFKISLEENESRAASLNDLNPWELDLYDYVTDEMSDNCVYFDDLTDQRSMMTKWFNEWAKSVKEDAETRGWYDKTSLRGAIYCGFNEFALFCAGIVSIVLAEPWGLIGTLFALIFGVLAMAIYKRTPEGEKAYRQWKAFKNGLKEGEQQRFEVRNIDKLFVYAIAVGLGEKDLKHWLSNVQVNESTIPWIIFAGGIHASPAEVAAGMSTLAATGLQTVSSVSGTTGASAGSSVGGAGGGAG